MASTFSPPNRFAYVASAAAAAATLFVFFKSTSKRPSRIASPLYTAVPQLSPQDVERLPYPPDALPGSRNVETPYGTIKVFEWGPEDGRRVLLIHGISTPSIALASMADHLVKRGCRVMLFDLFGRGFSDTPADVPHDARLYTTQILLVLASSPVPWTGTAGFDLVGYSFGGGISTNFARHFPDLVRSLILLAPGGIIRTSHISWQSRILYSRGLLPETLLATFVLRRLRPYVIDPADDSAPSDAAGVVEAAINAEVGRAASSDDTDQPIKALSQRPNLNPDKAVAWQLAQHRGFITAFMSSIRAGPIHEQHADWVAYGRALTARRRERAARGGGEVAGLHSDKVLLVLGATDPLVLAGEVAEDARAAFGAENVEVALIDAAHDFPISQSERLTDVICGFWGDR